MTVLANTWCILINNCDLLIPIGMDFSFEINRLLIPSFTNAMQTNFTNVIDSICLRIMVIFKLKNFFLIIKNKKFRKKNGNLII